LSLAGYVVSSLQRERRANPEPELTHEPPREPAVEAREPRARPRLGTPRRLAVGLALTTIFFAGAALTAGAGNEVAGLLDQSSTAETTSTDAAAPAAAPADTSVADPSATAPDPSATTTAPADTSTTDASGSTDPSASSGDDAPASGHGAGSNGVQASSGDGSAAPAAEGSAAAAPAVTPSSSSQAPSPTHAKRAHHKSQWVLSV